MKTSILNMTLADLERFWAKVDRRGPDECWPWLASLRSKGGYGAFGLGGGTQLVGAHQIAAFLTHGWPDPDDLFALHTCDNLSCCNGKHLFYGTNQDNQLDAGRKGRCAAQVHPEIVQGERHGMHILSNDQVKEIRMITLPQREIAVLYGVSQRAVWAIKNNRNWRHLA